MFHKHLKDIHIKIQKDLYITLGVITNRQAYKQTNEHTKKKTPGGGRIIEEICCLLTLCYSG